MESNLVNVDNDTLKFEFAYFTAICQKSKDSAARQSYMNELEKVFNESDQKHDGKIDRKEFERLIHGHFELKGIKSTKENFDKYFEKLDLKHEHYITKEDFIAFMDKVIENDVLPFLTSEMEDRSLL